MPTPLVSCPPLVVGFPREREDNNGFVKGYRWCVEQHA